MSRVEVNRFYCKLQLLRYGLVKEVQDVEYLHLKPKTGAASLNDDDDAISEASEDEDDIIQRRLSYVKQAIRAAQEAERDSRSLHEKIESISEERRDVLREFFADITRGKKCANCKGYVHALERSYFTDWAKSVSGLPQG